MTTITIDRALLEDTAEFLEDATDYLAKPYSTTAMVTAERFRAALATPATAPAQPAPERKPMTDEEVIDLVRECGLDWHKGFMPLFDDDPTNRFAVLVRAVEASHDIKDAP